ncbi:signal peptidase I [Ruminococcus sp.]|uniref:signal peptidase I n=1 Tax=Ruminococcus sp. TaxID=41978 RepID=UPI0038680F02
MSENKANTNETENNTVENTEAEVKTDNKDESSDYIAFSNPEKNNAKSNKFVAAKADGGASNFYDWIKSILFALVIVIFCLNFFFRLVDVKGTSMVETLQNGDKLVVTNFNYTPKTNDIVVISHGKEYTEPIVKRVIATAGQTLKLDYENDRILVDGVVLDEPYLDVSTFCNVEADYEIPEVIPDGMIFVMGDNRGVSMDSRDSRIGLISVDNVIGKAQLVVYPFSEFKYLY